MTSDVWSRILPAQRRMVAAIARGEAADECLARGQAGVWGAMIGAR